MSLFKQNFRGYLEYGPEGDSRRIEITHCSITFGINELPIANIQVAVGRDIATGRLEPNFDQEPETDIEARVYVRIEGDKYETGEQWDGQYRVLFRGFISAQAATRLSNKSAGNYTIRHWLSDLASANLLASYAHPGDSYTLVLPAYRRIKQSAGANSSDVLKGLMQEKIVYADQPVLTGLDLWTEIAKPFLINVCQQHPFKSVAEFPSCFPDQGGDNIEALAALSRIDGPTDEYGLEPDVYSALPVFPKIFPRAIQDAVRSRVTAPKVKDLLQMSAWTYILGQLCQPFLLRVIPGINRARIVPAIGTFNETYRTLFVNQVIGHDRNRPIDHPILATVMSTGLMSDTGAGGAPEEPLAFGPCYSPEGISKQGLVRLITPPAWLVQAQFSAFDPAATSKIVDGVAGGLYGDEEESDPADIENSEKEETLRADIQNWGRDYVKTVYADESLMGRWMKVITYFRGDISPGSQIKLISGDDMPGFGNVVYGMVNKVTLILDATTPMASTMLMLTHIRSENENQLNFLGVNRHPLFANTFLGSPLSDEFE